ncbi:MAG: asparagine synthase-related protein [Lachnospiraceae bacterium]|nr:asparagine synthase-related protein [Lachnospiraceae bacterium]
MYQIKEYRGHIRNWKNLCGELNIDLSLDREERERAILTAAFEKWGEKVGDHIYGMFAFAMVDDETGDIFACRDQFGTKPFYYYLTEDGRLLYGTFIRQIMAQEGFVKELNEDMLQLYMTLTYVAGEDTFFKGVKKLLPGRTLTFKNGQLEIKRYFRPEFHPDNSKSLEQWADEIHTTVTHIMIEVKEPEETAESFLSGGVDSSYVLAVSDAKDADTVGYDDERFDESPLAKLTADGLGVNLNRCRVTPEEYFAIVPWVMENMEQPLGDASAIAFSIGCKATAQHTKLCYSGEGSDEFFGGYNMYRNAERYGENLKTFYVGNTNIMKEDEKKVLLKNYKEGVLPIHLVEEIYKENEGADPLTKMQDVDIQIWLEGDIYLNVDKMSEAAGLEIRMPLTDLRVFDIASRMPSEYKVNAEQNKVAFRTAAAKVIPEEVAFRKKLGFVVPIRHWMADPSYNKDVYEKLHGADVEKFFNKEEVEKIWDEYLSGNSDLWRKVWVIYTFLVWYDIYFN